jgi:hypothetical protein
MWLCDTAGADRRTTRRPLGTKPANISPDHSGFIHVAARKRHDQCSVNHRKFNVALDAEVVSFARVISATETHGLRGGLYSCAASRLRSAALVTLHRLFRSLQD